MNEQTTIHRRSLSAIQIQYAGVGLLFGSCLGYLAGLGDLVWALLLVMAIAAGALIFGFWMVDEEDRTRWLLEELNERTTVGVAGAEIQEGDALVPDGFGGLAPIMGIDYGFKPDETAYIRVDEDGPLTIRPEGERHLGVVRGQESPFAHCSVVEAEGGASYCETHECGAEGDECGMSGCPHCDAVEIEKQAAMAQYREEVRKLNERWPPVLPPEGEES